MQIVLVVDSLRSVHNVGSLFRTANAAGIESMYLCGTTPTPLDTKGRKRSDFAKVALGAEESISWNYKEDILATLQELQQEGFFLIAIEQDEKAIDYKKISIDGKDKVAFIVGNEVNGLSESVLSQVNIIVEIKMHGNKESLNVTIAAGIALYRILDL